MYSKLLVKNKYFILENIKQAKQYISQGKLSEDDLKQLIKIDPTPTRKFVGWMAKIWINEKPDLKTLENTIKQYDSLLNKNKIETKDINQFKTFNDLKNEIDYINKSGKDISNKDLESDYETIINNSDLLIMSPHTHAASRKLGLTYFAFRDCEGKTQDSMWCTTYKSPDHFDDYYHKEGATLYYIKVKSEILIDKLKEKFPNNWKNLIVTALVVWPNGKIAGWDGTDDKLKQPEIKTFTNIIGIS